MPSLPRPDRSKVSGYVGPPLGGTFPFEITFLDSYSRLNPTERKTIDKAVRFLIANPRHPSLNVPKDLKLTFEYGPEPIMIALRNCGHHSEDLTKNLGLPKP